MAALENDCLSLPAGVADLKSQAEYYRQRRLRIESRAFVAPKMPHAATPLQAKPKEKDLGKVSLDDRLVMAFSGFRVTESNRAAYLAAKAFVRDQAGDMLFIRGGIGTGKSTLADAIRKCSSAVVIEYAGRKGAEITRAINSRRQIVITDSRGFELWDDAKVSDRCRGAMSVTIGDMTYDDAILILRHLEAEIRKHTPAFSVSDEFAVAIATHTGINGHIISGIVKTLVARHWAGQEAAIEDVYQLLPTKPKEVTVHDIIMHLCSVHNVRRIDLLSGRRTQNLVVPRQIAMYLAKRMTLRSLPEIGRLFGGRDHTTVIHACRKIAGQAENDAAFSAHLDMLVSEIEARAR